MKATSAVVNGQTRELSKDPVTDNGLKRSAKGRLAVVNVAGTLTLVDRAMPSQEAASELRLVWEDGRLIRTTNFDSIRTRAFSEKYT